MGALTRGQTARVSKRQPRTLLEWNVALAAAARHGGTAEDVTRWSALKATAGATRTAYRVAEFIAMWTVAKGQLGEVTTERVAEFFDMNERTAYRRLAEFRSVWGPPGLHSQMETPDELAEMILAKQAEIGRGIAAVTSLLSAPLERRGVFTPA